MSFPKIGLVLALVLVLGAPSALAAEEGWSKGTSMVSFTAPAPLLDQADWNTLLVVVEGPSAKVIWDHIGADTAAAGDSRHIKERESVLCLSSDFDAFPIMCILKLNASGKALDPRNNL